MTERHGFELLRDEHVAEINSRARIWRHIKTGAQLVSLENSDENKSFGITFFTPPPDSTGLPHIMEHSVLCGSRKYPLKEPFIELAKSSLNTFLNAMTSNDFTTYPVASQNLRDFYNLIDVYLDSVFHPLITPETLMQEGWHYELESPDASMVYKGVVFNEMKGAYSSPDQLLSWRLVPRTLFPDTFYGVDAGGDPEAIPDLTYENFKRFHETYYHPSNAFIYFYGDDDPDERLRILDGYLSEFDAATIDRTVPSQPRFDAPRRLKYPYDASDGNAKGYLAVNWLLTDDADHETWRALDILSYILVGTPASPLRKALIDSGLGEDLIGGGTSDVGKPLIFVTGMKGINPAVADEVEALILSTLERLVREGIDPDMIEAALNTTEFNLREYNTGRFPRGLAYMFSSLHTWLYGEDPLVPLTYEAVLASIRAKGAGYFEGLIQRYLLDNPHRTTVLLEPDPELAAKKAAAEEERLGRARESLSEAELRTIIDQTKELQRRQVTPDPPEALAKVPTLTLNDLDRQIRHIPVEVIEVSGVKVLYHDLFTNGIIYLDVGFDLHTLHADLLPLVRLFNRALLEMGTATEDYVKLTQRIGRKTGGIFATTFTSTVRGSSGSTAWTMLRGKATPAQAGEMLAILRDVLLTVKLDNRDRFRQIVLEDKARLESGLIPAGHRFAMTRLAAGFSEAGWLDEQMGGISYLFFLRQLAEEVERDWPSVLAKLETLHQTLINRRMMIANVTLDAANWAAFQPQLGDFLAALPENGAQPVEWSPVLDTASEGLTIPAQVNYVAKGANLVELGYQPDGSASVINNHLATVYLWERVRMQGGAYGGFSNFDSLTGVFSFGSYRDPNLLGTLATYDATADYLRELDVSDSEVERNIIGVIGDMDTYLLPDAKGFRSLARYLSNIDDAYLQQRRDEVLSTTPDDFRAFGESLRALSKEGRVVVVGAADKINAADEEKGGGWLRVTKVL